MAAFHDGEDESILPISCDLGLTSSCEKEDEEVNCDLICEQEEDEKEEG